jgi:hypothetical protein
MTATLTLMYRLPVNRGRKMLLCIVTRLILWKLKTVKQMDQLNEMDVLVYARFLQRVLMKINQY